MHAHDWPRPDPADWRLEARCAIEQVGYEFFTPRQGSVRLQREVREFCAGCKVRQECRRFALSGAVPWDDPAIYAGMGRDERNAMRTRRGGAL